jgi:copper chaperone CopZ
MSNSQKRKKTTENLDARFLLEVGGKCPLCDKYLLGTKGGRSVKLYDIAHIYPHSPTVDQLAALENVPVVKDIESFENRIALCKDCHKKQDFHTTEKDYMRLYNTKRKLLIESHVINSISDVQIEDQIKEVLEKLKNVDVVKIIQLSYEPVAVDRKICNENGLLREKIKDMVVRYFPFVQDSFAQIDSTGKTKFDEIATEFKLCFQKAQNMSQEEIFESLVKWLQSKTQRQYDIACEIIVAFFVQNCEVFDEISQ